MSELHPVHCIDADVLIEEVKARPSLYTKEAAKYGDTNLKKELWEQVASKLFESEWPTLTKVEKATRVDLASRRWRNIRACFSREIRRQKDPKWIYGVAYKRRKYVYYNELTFLKNELEQTEEDGDETQDIDVPENNGDDTKLTIDTNIEETPIPEAVPIPIVQSVMSLRNEMTLPETTTNKTNDIDSTNFALSLVPILNSLPMGKRITAQISILSVLKQFYGDDTRSVRDGGHRVIKTYGKRKAKDVVSIEIKSEDESEEEDKFSIND